MKSTSASLIVAGESFIWTTTLAHPSKWYSPSGGVLFTISRRKSPSSDVGWQPNRNRIESKSVKVGAANLRESEFGRRYTYPLTQRKPHGIVQRRAPGSELFEFPIGDVSDPLIDSIGWHVGYARGVVDRMLERDRRPGRGPPLKSPTVHRSSLPLNLRLDSNLPWPP